MASKTNINLRNDIYNYRKKYQPREFNFVRSNVQHNRANGTGSKNEK
jgi:hypothetical protein